VALPGMAPALNAVVVAPSRPEPQTEPTEVSPAPRAETRAPGAALTLPANPLSDLDAADLAGFVELTLLETSGRIDTRTAPAARGAESRGERARRIARRALPYASCLLVGLFLGIAFRPDAKVAVVVGAPNVVAPAPEAPPRPIDPAAAESVASPPARDCVARVTTTPTGAVVFWGDVALGPSPIDHATVPCGAATVRFRRERYADAARTIDAEPGHDTIVAERLSRPPARLVVTSSPPHARIKVNKRRFGETPRRISTMRFEHVRVEATLAGYRPWRKTIYLSEAESKVDVTLVRAPTRSSRAAQPAN